MRNWTSDTGSSLVFSLMAVLLLSALGASLVMTTNTELMLTKNFESSQQALYGADAGIEYGIHDLIREPSWSAVLSGGVTSGFLDSPPYRLPDGTSADLTAMTDALQSDTDTLYGPATANRPVWQLYAYGPLDALLPGRAIGSNGWVAVWVGDDPGETDGDPSVDGNATVLLHAEAYGEGGSRKVIEASAERTSLTNLERGYGAQRGQDEQNQRTGKAAVQTPGAALTGTRMSVTTGGIS